MRPDPIRFATVFLKLKDGKWSPLSISRNIETKDFPSVPGALTIVNASALIGDNNDIVGWETVNFSRVTIDAEETIHMTSYAEKKTAIRASQEHAERGRRCRFWGDPINQAKMDADRG